MTEPTPNDPPNPPPDREILLHPAEVLTHLIVTLLAPMFLMASGGDPLFARMAALETVNAYRARDHVDLIAIAQLVGCALAALGSIGLSMADDLSLSMTLRLRSNATAMNRSVEHARRALKEPRPATTTQTEVDPAYEAAVLAQLAEAQKMVEQATARHAAQQPAHVQKQAQPADRQPADRQPTDRQHNAAWAAAMSDVAGEFSASLIHLPPAERHVASRRIAALSSCANELLSGPIPPRLHPGDLAALTPPRPG